MTNMRPPNKTILLKVVILGDGGVGKSCLMNRFVSNRYDENNFHTIGVEFMNKDIEVDGEKYTLQIWDTAGQERFRALRTPFYRGSDVCLLCYAINDRDSFRGLKQWRDEFLNYADVKADKFPFIVVGNKNDTAPRNRQVSFNEVQHWCDDHNITSLIETSSKTATNVTEAFSMAVRRWKHMERVAEIELRQQHGDTIDLTKTIRLGNSRFCCIGGGGGGGSGCNVSSATASNYDSEEDSQLSSSGGTPRRQRHQQKHHRHQEQMNFTL